MFQYVYVPLAVVALACTAFAAQAEAPLSLATTSLSSGCGTNLTPSCQNSSVETNSCCFEAPGGWISQVQFWDTNPSTGPSTNWTIHGLWPNNCDGSYSEDCDPSRDYSDITSLLQDQGASSTLDFMQTYWISDDESNEAFWEAVAFFETAVNLFQSLPTYEWLEQAGITPGDSEYALSDLVSALQSAFGATPIFSCNDHNTIYQISYYFNLQGSMIDGQFDPVDAPSSSSCDSQVMYPAKTN
ncbi:Ribonuclease Le2 [Sparassis crispa]|uniref:Ribonuclease Le2 n=1 Tax=Sparassis crispa TaxID=139825 RepID=A0A401G5H7_9APHY|nr:Ribonuclease Le2 [Sparassis crispa]GBE77418.1 Ribonuclease Le2 [Sparassis crispa]